MPLLAVLVALGILFAGRRRRRPAGKPIGLSPGREAERPRGASGDATGMQMLASIVEHSSDAIIAKRLDGTITAWNGAAERMFGHAAHEAIGEHISLLIPPDRIHEEATIIDRISRGQRVEPFTTQRRHRDGRLLDVSLTISPVRDGAGRIMGAAKIVRDITLERAAIRALRESVARFRQLADSMPQIVFQTDGGGRLEHFNRRWYEYTGRRETLTLPIDREVLVAAIHPDDLEPTAGRWEQGLATGQPYEFEFRLRHAASGRYRWQLARAVPFRDDSGRIVRWFGTSTDIDDLKRAEDRAKQQQATLAHLDRVRTIGQMASGLAHELNQPLGAILNYSFAAKAAILRASAGDAVPRNLDAARSILDEIATEAERAGEIIRRIRGFVQKQQPATAPRDINQIVRETVCILAFDLRAAKLQPKLNLCEHLPPVPADAVQIQQVLVNLVRNAIDAMDDLDPADRDLELTTDWDPASGVRVSVADRGPGVPVPDRERVFDSFFTTKPHGLGMGLALCRTIIEDHGGVLLCTEHPGGGTIFIFTLPHNNDSKCN